MDRQSNIRIGISGWRYKGWRGIFYPAKLAQRRELEFASREFSTIEINGTFYSLQRATSFQRWKEETPEDFVFAIKGSRYITHLRRLREVELPLANFFAQGLLQFGEKLGPILWQFPPSFRYDRATFESFFEMLPVSTRAAAALAGSADGVPRTLRNRRLRHCVEIRNESFVTPDFIDLLRRYNVGLVVADTVEWPLLMDVTSDFVYCRLHGSEQLYASGYTDASLKQWAARIAAWARGGNAPDGRFAHTVRAPYRPRDVYVYFDNDMKVRAPVDAKKLLSLVAELLPSKYFPREPLSK